MEDHSLEEVVSCTLVTLHQKMNSFMSPSATGIIINSLFSYFITSLYYYLIIMTYNKMWIDWEHWDSFPIHPSSPTMNTKMEQVFMEFKIKDLPWSGSKITSNSLEGILLKWLFYCWWFCWNNCIIRDKTKVTISGESAGAGSVCFHIASPRSAGLFQKVFICKKWFIIILIVVWLLIIIIGYYAKCRM